MPEGFGTFRSNAYVAPAPASVTIVVSATTYPTP
jgi:hypothetical protein